ncbi:MAG: cache domain-containing protein [Cellulosilyticaceae bacterium]
MKHTKHTYSYLILFISLFLITTSSLCTTLLCHYHFKKNTLPTFLSSLDYTITYMQQSLDAPHTQLDYTLSLLLDHPSVTSLDVHALPSLLGEFLFYSPQVSNAYMININNEVIAGVNNNALLHIDYRAHIDSALNGSFGTYSSSINAEPFLQNAFPIYSDGECVGALVLTYDLTSITKEFSALKSHFPNMQFYLLDESGKLLSSSELLDQKKFVPTTDITKLCSAIDYAPLAPFTFLDSTSSYGRYYHPWNTNWTLLVTSSPPALPTYLFFFFFGWYLLIALVILFIGLFFRGRPKKVSSDAKNTIYWT